MPRAIAALTVLVCLTAAAPRARAQSSSEIAAARTLFREGLAAAHDGDWDEARQRFERSYAIAPRATTLLNLAGAQVQTGRLVAGAESYRRFLAEASEGREARYREQAESALAEVERRIAHAVITVDGLAAGDVVMLDDEELARAALGVDLPVDPGTRTIVVRRGETERAREVVMLGEGERREVRVAAVDLAVAAEPAQTSAPEAALAPDAPAAGGDDSGLWIGLGVGLGVVVVAAAAIAIGLAVDASSATYSGNFGPGTIQFE